MIVANYDLQLTNGWRFHYGELPQIPDMPIGMFHATSKAGGALKELDMFRNENEWQNISLPHDWMTSLPYDPSADPGCGYKERGTGWYYLSFQLPDIKIQFAELVFDGVLGRCEVFVNGVLAVRNFSGYNRFRADISDYLLPGEENTIALHVDARRWEGWWYEGAGLYRKVYIRFREFAHFDLDQCFVKPVQNGSDWYVTAQFSTIDAESNMQISACLKNKDGKIISAKSVCADTRYVQFLVEGPVLWSPEEPYLYDFSLTLLQDDSVIDSLCVSTGLRSIEWSVNGGMYLNGKRYSVKGICCHQDHAGVGAAIPQELMEYRIAQLKKLGINAYRCAHHAPDEEILRICDRLGMLVMVENRNFAVSEDVLKQVDALVYVSRNHPSVFLYSLFNEEPWQQEERGRRIANKLRSRIQNLDNTRMIIGAQNGGMLEDANASDVLDVIGVNYFLQDYEKTHEKAPSKVMIGTENCPTYTTRGVYHSDPEKQIFANYGDEWGSFSESLEETMLSIYSKDYVAGCFPWCGFDHRGEPTPYAWPSVLSHWGFSDYCGFPKDTAYLLAAWFRNDLFAHLLPHWNHTEGEIVRVCVYTNAESAQLFINDQPLETKQVQNRRAEWEVSFEPGELKVCVRSENQQVISVVKTALEPAQIVLENVSPVLRTNIRIINMSVTDINGTLIPNFCDEATLTTQNSILLGVGNGDPNSHHDEKGNKIRFFNGRAQAILKGASGSGLLVQCQDLSAKLFF